MIRRIVIVGLIALTAVLTLAGIALAQEYRCTVTGVDGDATLFRCIEVTPAPTDEPTPEPTATPTETPAPPSVAFVLVTGPDANGAGQTLTNGIEVQPGTYSIRVDGVEPPQSIVLDGPIAHRQTENIMPIMLFGDGNGTLNVTHLRDFPTGNYTISAADVTIAFSVVAEQEPPTPTPTATPDDGGLVGIPGDPYASAPICPDDLSVNPELHKQQRLAHGLWDAERGCYYTHTHNANPDNLISIFGDHRAITGAGVGYAWETPMENEMKHPGYKWLTYDFSSGCGWRGQACITHLRLQFHGIGSGVGFTTRFHSFFQQTRACFDNNDDSTCGLMTTGGWNDYGDGQADYPRIHSPYKENWCSSPETGDPSIHEEPYIGVDPANDFFVKSPTSYPWSDTSVWSSHNEGPGIYGYNQTAGQVIMFYDDWGGIYCNDLERNRTNPHIATPDGSSVMNNSSHAILSIGTFNTGTLADRAPQWFSESTVGGRTYVTGSGWTDRKGDLNLACTATGPDCIPLIVQNYPAVYETFWGSSGNGSGVAREFDVSPAGVRWIQYPN